MRGGEKRLSMLKDCVSCTVDTRDTVLYPRVFGLLFRYLHFFQLFIKFLEPLFGAELA
jgi:hypothetical protein